MFEVGDKVICINDFGVKDKIAKNEVYTISMVDDGNSVVLDGISKEIDYWYNANRFIRFNDEIEESCLGEMLEICKEIVNIGENKYLELNCDDIECNNCIFNRHEECDKFTKEKVKFAKCYVEKYLGKVALKAEPIESSVIKKTLLEIIKDGFNNKVYVDKYGNTVYYASNDQLVFNYKEVKEVNPKVSTETLSLNLEYTLERKKYTFTEAFAAYEAGKEIESCVSGFKYRINNGQHQKRGNGSNWFDVAMIKIEEIHGKWYINN